MYCYLDYAAATPLDKTVLDAMNPYFSELFYNPSALYLPARFAAQALTMARAEVGKYLGAKQSQIVFTSGATEANNLAIWGIMSKFKSANIVVSAIEHESVLIPAQQYNVRIAPVNNDGRIDLAKLSELIDDKTALVSLMYANNEVGTIQPIKEVSEIIAQKRSIRKGSIPLYLHTDATQAANYLDLHMSSLGVDMMSLNGGKIYGPKGVGVLGLNSKVTISPQILGGGQERGLRSGTENIAQAVGFAKALSFTQQLRHNEEARVGELQIRLLKFLDFHQRITINNPKKNRLPNIVNFWVNGFNNERLLMELEKVGFLVATGSACSASSGKPSHVLSAMGLSDSQAQSSIRVSMGRATTVEQIDDFCVKLENIIKK